MTLHPKRCALCKLCKMELGYRMSKLHDMKLQYQCDPLMFKRKKPAGDIDFGKNPLEEFEQQLKKRHGK